MRKIVVGLCAFVPAFTAVARADEPDMGTLQEVVVTAQKRQERLQDVPVPVTSISGDSLVDSNQTSLDDYYDLIPGLSATNSGNSSQLTIRGLTTGAGTNPTVGITIDDVPFGSSSALGYGQVAADLDPSDLARVEVLRGPQGTLYGASSLGGLVKYVTIDPSTAGFSGRVQGGADGVYGGNQAGYNFRGSVNVPLGDTLAVRASAFDRRDPGYIDNVETGLRDVNSTQAEGGRVAVLWRPSEDFSVKLSGLYQDSVLNGADSSGPQLGLGELQQNMLAGTGGYKSRIEAYNATLSGSAMGINVTSITGYSRNAFTSVGDFTPFFGPLTQSGIPGTNFTGFGVPGTSLVTSIEGTKLTEELRLNSSIGARVDWLAGAFFNRETSPEAQNIFANAADGSQVGTWLLSYDPSTLTEYAGFADITVHVTDQFNIQVGGRESENRQSYSENFTGPYAQYLLGMSPFIYPEEHSRGNSFTYLVTPQYKFSPDLMVYARLASGYRPGGPNVNAASFGLPPAYQPDKTENYELGVKGDTLEHRLTFDASLYYISWKNIQLSLVDPNSDESYNANGGDAKSEGVELASELKPLQGLTLSAWVTWNEAVLTQDLPTSSSVYGLSGDRLPYGSRISASFSFNEEFHLTDRVIGFVGGDESYVGQREGDFQGPPPQQRTFFPGYAKTNLRGGVKYDTWMFNLFINNATDRRGISYQSPVPPEPVYIRPRTAGFLISKTF
jgi:iron complex outermembrane recepter protein